MAKEYEIHHRETGSLGENDEYWTLVVPDRGNPIIRRDCFWGNPYRGQVNHSTPEETPLYQFLAEQNFGVVHGKLTELLRRLRVDPNA
jgi:hypothetical protein